MFPLTTRTSVRKTRGKNKNKRLNELVKNGPIDLLFEDECRAPVGENSSCWSREISEVVKNHCDLHHVRWSYVPNSMKEMLEALVMDNFKLDLSQKSHQSGLGFQLGKCYSRYRSELYQAYQRNFEGLDMTDSTAVANAKVEARDNVPKGVSREKWPAIYDSFESKYWVETSARNKKNRSEMVTNHTAGSCSFVNVIYKTTKATSQRPKPIAIYKDTHIRKNGTFVNPEVEKLYNEMESMANDDNLNSIEEEIFSQVLRGHRSGHVRGMGGGVIPTPSSSSRARHPTQFAGHNECMIKQQETEIRLEESLSHISTLQASNATLQESYTTLQASNATLQASNATLQSSYDTMQAQLDSILQHIRGHGGSSSGGH
ncbi:uncharacterized protein LOC133879172 [Alnus glutinosa]|uniref:uncharacterized protein LOC133879172 n=1 Tax=Alnus glutinosa TaxID=3517 RepID=UPI002D78435F|nr:uncharacterized protein LOC133879172 [Alnus glutinosa]